MSLLWVGTIFAVFFSVRHLDFTTYDERFQLTENQQVRSLSSVHLKSIFTTRNQFGSYYPIRTLSFAMEYALWELHPKGYHLTQMVIHALNVLLVFRVASRLAGNHQPMDLCCMFFGVGVFAIHPAVVEPVAWVGAREELLMTLGVLLCLLFYMNASKSYEDSGISVLTLFWYIAATLAGAMACFSSVLGAVTPFLVISWDILHGRRKRLRDMFVATSGLWVLAGLTILLKMHERIDLSPGLTIEVQRSLVERFALVLSTYWLNLKTILWPAKLALLYPMHGLGFPPFREILLGAMAGCFTIVLFWICRHRPTCLFGICWFILGLAPGSQILPHQLHRADRLLYLPLVGLSILAGQVLLHWRRKGVHVLSWMPLSMVLMAIWIVLSVRQIPTWKNGVTVFQQCLKVDPQSAVVMNNLGQAYKRLGEFELAEKHLWGAVRRKPGYFLFRHNLADLYRLQGNLENAAYHYERAAEILPGYEPLIRWAKAPASEREASIQGWKETLLKDPENVDALHELAWTYLTWEEATRDHLEEAVLLATRACELTNRKDPNLLHTLMEALAKAGQIERSTSIGREALELARIQNNLTLAERLEMCLHRYEKER